MGAKQVTVTKTVTKRTRAFTPTKSNTPSKGKGQKRCPSCGKYM